MFHELGRAAARALFAGCVCILLPGCPPPCVESGTPVAGEVFQVDGFGTIATLGQLGDTPIVGERINAAGTAVGYAYGWCDAEAFRWENGEVLRLDTLGGTGAHAFGINSHGQIVGTADTGRIATAALVPLWLVPVAEWRAVLWEDGQSIRLGDLAGTMGSGAAAINDAGQIVGWAELPWGQDASVAQADEDATDAAAKMQARATSRMLPPRIPVLWEYVDGGWQATDLRAYGLGSATDINNRGEIVGGSSEYASLWGPGRALLWSDGVLTDLGTLGGENSGALAINDLGQVVGLADTADFLDQSDYPQAVTHAFLWHSGEMTDLGTLGGDASIARDINNHAQIVGTSETGELRGDPEPWYRIEHAFIWQDGKMTDLNALLPPGSGWEFLSAVAINDSGQILAEADHDLGPDESGIPQGRLEYVVITLTPEALQRASGAGQP